MNTHSEPGFDEVAEVLRDFGDAAPAAEIHGHFCGLACVLGAAAGPLWANTIVADADPGRVPGPALRSMLENLANTTWNSMSEGDMSLRLLLPADEHLLSERADSLASWCAGFLHGLGTGDSSGEFQAVLKAGATGDILADFSELTRASVSDDEVGEDGEVAYAELVEFVRVSVQLVFEELQQIRSSPADARTH